MSIARSGTQTTPEGGRTTTKVHTAGDFRSAKFASANDRGLLAIRAFPDHPAPWLFVTRKGTHTRRTDREMARGDWVPVAAEAPRQTMTESRLEELVEYEQTMPYNTSGIVRDVVYRVGIEIIPDPEPTNAERLEELFAEIMREQMTYKAAGEWLDKAGVKAPEGEL